MIISFHPLTNRQVADSHFTHWTISNEEVMKLVVSAIDGLGQEPDTSKPLVLSIPPVAFYSPMVKLEEGDRGVWDYNPRHGQEEAPRKSLQVVRPGALKLAAGTVEVVLYAHKMLEADGDASSDADWEIITINASADGCPMDPDTFIANHLGLDGGTDHKLTDAEAWAELKKIKAFHDCHAQLAPVHHLFAPKLLRE